MAKGNFQLFSDFIIFDNLIRFATADFADINGFDLEFDEVFGGLDLLNVPF